MQFQTWNSFLADCYLFFHVVFQGADTICKLTAPPSYQTWGTNSSRWEVSFALGNGESDPRVGDYPVAILVAVADNSVGHGQSLGQIAGEMRLEMFGASSRTRTGCRVTFGRFCWPCFPTRQFCRQSTTIQKSNWTKTKTKKTRLPDKDGDGPWELSPGRVL